jgi:hypothetical protein
MNAASPIKVASPKSLSKLSLTEKISIRGAWIAAAVSGALILFTLLAVVALLYWRRARRSPRNADTHASEHGAEQDPASASTDNVFAAVSYNVTPPLPPPQDDEGSEDEDDVAQHWSNGVVLLPDSHPVPQPIHRFLAPETND